MHFPNPPIKEIKKETLKISNSTIKKIEKTLKHWKKAKKKPKNLGKKILNLKKFLHHLSNWQKSAKNIAKLKNRKPPLVVMSDYIKICEIHKKWFNG